jgi:hypothetical protein
MLVAGVLVAGVLGADALAADVLAGDGAAEGKFGLGTASDLAQPGSITLASSNNATALRRAVRRGANPTPPRSAIGVRRKP